MKKCIFLCFFSLLLFSCVEEEEFSNSPKDNLRALWQIIDEHYCFFEYKKQQYGLDWNTVWQEYSNYVVADMSNEQLFEISSRMLKNLRDGHVNLSSSFDMARYWEWFENYPINFSDSIQRKYLGTDYRITQGIKYRVLQESNIGYMYCPSFDYSLGSGNLSSIFSYLALCKGLIVDVRNNGGGMLTSAQALAESFINEKTIGGYMSHKVGKGHFDFSSPQPIELFPSEGIRWQKPVVVLTNRSCYSAANTFVMFMKAFPQVCVMGSRTGGGGGMPFSSELPNGWRVRFSACPIYDTEMQITEHGIDPDVEVSISSEDWQKSTDTMIETAINYLKK